jgi:ATP-dependent exoDNAse (exonuclease V) beta subunit
MTRAIDRLIVAGSVGETAADERTPIGWVLGRLEIDDLEEAAETPLELERERARILVRLGRFEPEIERPAAEGAAQLEPGQLALFETNGAGGALVQQAPVFPALEPIAAPPLHRVRRLSYSALALYESCSYRYYAERVAGMRAADAAGSVPGQAGLAATEIGDSVHVLLEHIDLRDPRAPSEEELAGMVRARYPAATADDIARIVRLVHAYCDSELAHRLATLDGAAPERPFAFEHDGVLLHGRLDVLHQAEGRALVVDYKTNALEERTPEEVAETSYRVQRLVYALACLRGGADEVEVVYQFLERPDDLVRTTFAREELPELEAELSAAIARIQDGVFVPTPSEFICSGCPVLDVVCAGPRLRQHHEPPPVEIAVG